MLLVLLMLLWWRVRVATAAAAAAIWCWRPLRVELAVRRRVVRSSSFRRRRRRVGRAVGHGLLDWAGTALLLPLGRVGLYPPGRWASGDFVPADDFGDFGVLLRAEPVCGSVGELLEDFFASQLPGGIEQPLVVEDVDEVIGNLGDC